MARRKSKRNLTLQEVFNKFRPILQDVFYGEKEVVIHLIKIKEMYGLHKCPSCGSKKIYQRVGKKIRKFQCMDKTDKGELCNRTFSVFHSTIFENTSTKLLKWIYVLDKVFFGIEPVTAKGIAEEMDITYKTAWRMLDKIKKAKADSKQKDFLEVFLYCRFL